MPPCHIELLTTIIRATTLSNMQVTIDIPEELAERLQAAHVRLAEILERGLRLMPAESSALAQELVDFLSGGPSPEEIIAFRPSEHSVSRARQLLEKNQEGSLTFEENSELDEMARLNQLFMLIKAQARNHLPT